MKEGSSGEACLCEGFRDGNLRKMRILRDMQNAVGALS
jgi:hypothetical protein